MTLNTVLSTLHMRLALRLGTLVCLVLLVGCLSDSTREPISGVIRIGVLYPFSGPDAATGQDLKAGLDLAVEIINHSHEISIPLAMGSGLPGQAGNGIELVFRDTESDPAVAARELKALVSSGQGIVAVIGCYHSSVTALASEQAEMQQIPFLNPESTSPLLVQRGLKWFFRTTPDDEMFSRNFFEFLNDMRLKGLLSRSQPLALVYENGLWGTSVAQAQQRQAWQQGYNIALDVPYAVSAENFQPELERIASVMPGVILQASYTRDSLEFVKGYRSARMQPIAILGMDSGFISPQFVSTLGEDAESVLSREVWALDLSEKKPLVKVVNDLFHARYQRDMTGNSARSFTGLIVLAEAINRAKGLTPQAIRVALAQTDLGADQLVMPWDGIRFDPETGQNILGKGIIVQVQQGRYVTVWPDSLAVRPPVWTNASTLKEK
jgi:branched-chain amino acid transport system substrate-binding protein